MSEAILANKDAYISQQCLLEFIPHRGEV